MNKSMGIDKAIANHAFAIAYILGWCGRETKDDESREKDGNKKPASTRRRKHRVKNIYMEPQTPRQSQQQQMPPSSIHGTWTPPLTFFTKTADRNARLFPAHDEVWMMLGHDSYLQNKVYGLEYQ
jgi:hypothetical protein